MSTCDKTHSVHLRDVLVWERVGLTAWRCREGLTEQTGEGEEGICPEGKENKAFQAKKFTQAKARGHKTAECVMCLGATCALYQKIRCNPYVRGTSRVPRTWGPNLHTSVLSGKGGV